MRIIVPTLKSTRPLEVMMLKFRMLACASTLSLVAVACGGGAPAEETAAPAPAAVEEAATPAAGEGAAAEAPADRPRLVAPVRGTAQLAYTQPTVKTGTVGGKEFIITTMQVKNMASGAIAGLRIDDFWYDSAGNPLPSDSYRHPRPLQPGEIITVTLETPRTPAMNRNQWQFSHANGDITPTLVTTM
jgi:hypothetical protein